LLCCADEPIGYAKICDNNSYSLLVEIFVKNEFRQLSLGTFLLDSIREYVKSINSILRTITLPSDRVAKNFYEANGITARVLLMEEKRENNRYRP
jgi:GNAT superfamily N-acetyltransferase